MSVLVLILVFALLVGSASSAGLAEPDLLGRSHGPDPIPTGWPGLDVVLPDPGYACVAADEAHFRIVYALPRDATAITYATGYAGREPLLRAALANANAILYQTALAHGVGLRIKTLCDDDGRPAIDQVRLNTRSVAASFESIADEVLALGYGGQDEKVLVLYDASLACGCGGMATIPGGDEAGPQNPNNHGWSSIAIVFLGNYGAQNTWAIDEVILHEVTHTMGGVQPSAPHASGAPRNCRWENHIGQPPQLVCDQWGAHCNDGWDIMCYADEGSSSDYSTTACPAGLGTVGASQPYDCGSDDYFHPDPAPGSYLDTHWNVGAAYNRFLQRG